MKTRLFYTCAFVFLAGSVFAQQTLEWPKDLKRDEVPAAVLTAQKKMATKSETEGQWELFYLETIFQTGPKKAKYTPEFYKYTCKVDGKIMEYFYKPDGTTFKRKGEPPAKK